MKIMKSREVPAYVHTYVDKVNCDICGENVAPSAWGSVSEVTISHKEGYTCDDDTHGEASTKMYDICGKCFAIRVEPIMLREFGIVPRVENCDW